jgi:hypothetical protein
MTGILFLQWLIATFSQLREGRPLEKLHRRVSGRFIDMAVKKKKPAKVIPFPSRLRKIVRAAKVDYHFAPCPECGNKIKLEPGPLLQSSKGLHFPVLIGQSAVSVTLK